MRYGKLGLKSIVVSAPDFAQVRDSKNIFQSAALETTSDFNYSTGEFPERLRGAQVSWQWFDVFGARPILGRVFTPEEDQPNANREVVLAYPAWQHWFGGDPNIVGRSIRLNEQDYRVIGLLCAATAMRMPISLVPIACVGLYSKSLVPVIFSGEGSLASNKAGAFLL